MKIEEYKELERKIEGQNFNQGYKTINIVMKVLSYFGHIASIFLAYFMLSKVLSEAMTDNIIAVGISSIIILGGIELLKRDLFDKFSIQYLKLKTLGKQVLPLFLLCITIIGISFYASISGAKEFSSKDKQIEVSKKDDLNIFKDSITKTYTNKIVLKEQRRDLKEKTLNDIQTLAVSQKLSKDQRNTIPSLKTEIDSLKSEITQLTTERDGIISNKELELNSDSNEKKKDNSENSSAFIIISVLIEITILAGVFFNQYYRFRSYREYRDKITKDPNFQKWLLYDQVLTIIYTEDTKMNQKLPSNKSIIEMCKISEIIVMPKDIIDFLKIMGSIGIIKTSGSTRYFNKQRDLSFELLKKNFGIE